MDIENNNEFTAEIKDVNNKYIIWIPYMWGM